MNSDIVQGCFKIQVQKQDFQSAIRTKEMFIEFLKREGTIDH